MCQALKVAGRISDSAFDFVYWNWKLISVDFLFNIDIVIVFYLLICSCPLPCNRHRQTCPKMLLLVAGRCHMKIIGKMSNLNCVFVSISNPADGGGSRGHQQHRSGLHHCSNWHGYHHLNWSDVCEKEWMFVWPCVCVCVNQCIEPYNVMNHTHGRANPIYCWIYSPWLNPVCVCVCFDIWISPTWAELYEK